MPEQPQSFHCPTCGASLPMTAEEMVRCEYCGSNVLVPPDFRQEVETPQPEAYAPQVAIHVIDLPQAPPQLNKFVVGVIIAGVLFVILIGVISAVFAGGVGLFAASRSIDLVEDALSEQAVIPSLAPTAIPSPTPIPTQTPIPFASLVAVFDGKTGEQAQVDDPRNIAIDPQGNIYIANYGTGLIYKLNSEGQFEYLVQIDPGPNLIPFISDLAVDNAGRLYAVRGGDILKLDAVSGTQVGILPGSPPETYYTKLATDPAENLYAVHYSARGQDLIRLDADGKTLWRIEDIIAKADPQANFGELGLAADPSGYAWLVNRGASQVYRFDPIGNFASKFGSQGNDPGELWSPDQIAVKTGLVLILDASDIDLFSEQGTYIDTIPVGSAHGTPRDIAVDEWENIYVITSKNQILKYQQNIVVRVIE